jgi:glycosyltransferase involved in cell wall biosynthesis
MPVKISVVTPSFNQGQFLEETITSVLRQTYPHKELIVIDGGSRDASVSILEKYGPQLAFWVSEKDRGQSHAINKGLARATGDVVTWLNSDDRLADGALARVADYFAAEPDVGVVHGGAVLFDAHGVRKVDFGYPDPCPERYLSGMAFPQPASFFRRRWLEHVGPLSETHHFGMDYDLFARLALCTRFRKVDAVLADYRLHDSSKTVLQDDRFIEDWIATFLDVLDNLERRDLLERIRAVGGLDDHLARPRRRFGFAFDPPALDADRLLFYFFSYVAKADYRAGRYPRARRLLGHLARTAAERLSADSELTGLRRRLWLLPDFCLRAAKTTKARLRRALGRR